jgi:DNA repair protein SbcD/Mre11
LPPSRKYIDLEVPAFALSPADIDKNIEALVSKAEIDGNIVRVVLKDVQRHIVRELNHAKIRDYQRRALHFQLDARRPESDRAAVSGASGRKLSLTDIVREKLQTREIEADLDRNALVDMGLHYLKEAEAVEVPE